MAMKLGFSFVFFVVYIFGKGALGAGHTSDLVKAITYNIAAFDFSPEPGVVDNNREQRVSATIDALRNSDADLVCLQEVWIAQDLETIVKELADVYTYSYSPLHNSADGSLPPQTNIVQNGVCDRNVLLQLGNCSKENNCENPDVQQLIGCASVFCQQQLFALLLQGQECVSCVGVSTETIEIATARCSTEDNSPANNTRTMNTIGLAMLSKRPLSDQHTEKFYNVTAFIDKGYISAKFDGNLRVVCNHLTAINPNFIEPFISQFFPTSIDQNKYEVDLLTRKYRYVSPLLFLGDTNNGDAFTNKMVAKAPGHYQQLRRGFETTARLYYCTFCPGDINPYNVGNDYQSIDHIFGNGIQIRSSAVIFRLEEVNVTDGQGNIYPLSDHYGVEAVFRYPCLKFDPFLQSSSISNILL